MQPKRLDQRCVPRRRTRASLTSSLMMSICFGVKNCRCHCLVSPPACNQSELNRLALYLRNEPAFSSIDQVPYSRQIFSSVSTTPFDLSSVLLISATAFLN
jgi:hypothetical protein